MVDELTEFIEANPDARELKRATSVKMYQQGYKHREITKILGVVSSFISKWTQIYEHKGVAGLLLAHKGSTGYLNQSQRQEIITWLQGKS